jgi:cell division septum initiation protein DivIVA
VSDTERKPLSIFDNAPTGGFHVRSRGYDREQVERYVRKLEDKLREALARGAERGELLERAEERIAELSGEMTDVRGRLELAESKLRNAEQPSFSGLGDHVATLLRSAEEQAATLLAQASAEADRMRSEATAAADQTRREADAYAVTTRTDADTAAERSRAEAEADAARWRQEANQDATAVRVAAVDESKATLAEAQEAAADLRASADRDADLQREAAATLLREARQRADHEVGAVTSALDALRRRLTGQGVPVQTTLHATSAFEPASAAHADTESGPVHAAADQPALDQAAAPGEDEAEIGEDVSSSDAAGADQSWPAESGGDRSSPDSSGDRSSSAEPSRPDDQPTRLMRPPTVQR